MKTLLRALFIKGWQRKAVSILLALVIWLVVNHSLTTVRTLTNVPVKIVNIPPGKSVQGLGPNDYLLKKTTLTLTGNQSILEEITANDLEVHLDAADMDSDDWNAEIKKKNLRSLNPDIDIAKVISRVTHTGFFVHLTQTVTETIPVIVTRPSGVPPRGYDFLDVWPYQLNVKVSGPQAVINSLKSKVQKLTFDLTEITHEQLDALEPTKTADQKDVYSFFVPDLWKQIYIPLLSDTPVPIDDPMAKALRIDFIHRSLQPIDYPVSISVFYPPELVDTFNPETVKFGESEFITIRNGIPYLKIDHLFAKGGSDRFVEITKNRLHLKLCVSAENGVPSISWNLEFTNNQALEDEYVKQMLALATESSEENIKPQLREDYLRNRFRSYMHHFVLFTSDNTKLRLKFELKDGAIVAREEKS